ncbi:hypothetical protein GCM10022221_13590 [Actinocorallia aurea]
MLAREQARTVADAFPQADLLVGAGVSRVGLLSRLAQATYDVMHFTGHGVFDAGDPMQSGIELADGRLTAADLLGMRLDVGLVTLGACETGVSDRRPGDELVGLTRALLYAGAASALVTLWQVDELSTSVLLARFYRELTGGVPKAQALRLAQQAVREMTVRDAVDHVRGALKRPGLEPLEEQTLRLELARLRLRGGERTAHDEIVRDLLARPDLPTPARAEAEKSLGLSRLAAWEVSRRDPDRKAFDDPFHWAAFVLIGDGK